jgi:formate/nitrite transporter FocA (FNT family)
VLNSSPVTQCLPRWELLFKVSWAQVINLWIWVYIGTGWDVAGVATVNAFGMSAVKIAVGKVGYIGGAATFSAFLKAIGCNWLVNLAVLLGICADDAVGKFFGIWFPIMAFVSSGFEHCVANMYFIPAGLFLKGLLNPEQVAEVGPKLANLSWVTMWTNNIIVVTIGNVLGGLFFVGILYWLAFRDEIAALK